MPTHDVTSFYVFPFNISLSRHGHIHTSDMIIGTVHHIRRMNELISRPSHAQLHFCVTQHDFASKKKKKSGHLEFLHEQKENCL